MADENKNLHSGHRQKVRNRFYECGFNGMPEHNILEFLLFFGIPRKDTNEIAHELIEHFGSLSNVFEAKREDLVKIKGMTENAACLITMVLPLYAQYVDSLCNKKAELTSTNSIVKYLQGLFSRKLEQIYLLCFDSNHSLITTRLIGEGDISSATFDSRKLVSIILETNARMVVLAHNHPHGLNIPSKEDVQVTEFLFSLLKSLKVTLADHLIVTDNNYCSMAKTPRYAHIFYGAKPLFDDE